MTALQHALRLRTFRSLRRHHNYRLFFAGQVVSLAGSWMQNVALAWLVLSVSGSPVAVGMLVLLRFGPYAVLGLFAGSVVDRIDTRRLVIWTQAAAMATSVGLFAVAAYGSSALWPVYLLAALGGVLLVLDAPARQALTFELVGPRELPNAVALNSTLLNGARVLGPALAGLVIAWAGVAACFAVNAVSFLAVLVALAMMRSDELHPVEKDAGVGLVAGTVDALRHVAGDPVLRGLLLVVSAVGLTGFNPNIVVPLLASDALTLGPRSFGVLSAMLGLGALAGALLAATARRARLRAVVFGALVLVAAQVALGLVGSPSTAGAALLVAGFGFTVLAANTNALLQLAAPPAMRGRVVSFYLFAAIGLAAGGSFLAGWLVEVGGVRLAFWVGAAAVLGSLAPLWRAAGNRASAIPV
ncbi:MAG: MFS transporter [Gaiella sp.]